VLEGNIIRDQEDQTDLTIEINEIEIKSVEAETLGICHGRREVGRKASR
jgi:hypothetical protein